MEEEINQRNIPSEPKKIENLEEKKKRTGTQLKPWQFKKGQSGNPAGRPKGKTMKEYARELLACQTEEERQAFLHGLPKEVIWKMAEGNPQTDITSKGEKINPIPIINVIPTDNGDKQDNADVKTVEDSPGGDVGKQNDIDPDISDSAGPDGQKSDADKHSVGELPAPSEGSGEGLPEHNEGTPILPRQELGQD